MIQIHVELRWAICYWYFASLHRDRHRRPKKALVLDTASMSVDRHRKAKAKDDTKAQHKGGIIKQRYSLSLSLSRLFP
jgi:hypothetical protein